MLGRDDHVGRAEQSVRTGGVDGQGIALGGLEVDLRAGRASDPVLLLGLDALDVVDVIQIVDQALGVLGDGQHPLALGLAHDLGTAALAYAANDFLVCQHALTGGAPVDGHLLLVCQTVLEQLEEDPLGPLIVVRVGGVDLTRPVKGQAERLELALEACDVLLGDLCRMDVVLDGEVLGRQAKRIPAHRIKHVIALHTLFARNDIERRVRARMAYMQALARRIRELYQRIELRLCKIIRGDKAFLFVPDPLPFCLDSLVIVFVQRYNPQCFYRAAQPCAAPPAAKSKRLVFFIGLPGRLRPAP